MAATYTPIASITLGAASTSVIFNNIPQTYTDLVLVVNGKIESTAINAQVRLNSDSGTNYSYTDLSGTGSVAASSRETSNTYIRLGTNGYVDTTFGFNCVAHFMNYSNTTTYKTVLSRSNNANNGVSLVAALWRSTAAITSINFYNGNYSVGSTFNLYGILGANA